MDSSPPPNKPTPTQLAHMTEQERTIWTGRSDDERAVLHTPPGYRYTLVLAAWMKRVLLARDLSVGDRLWLLEGINELVDGTFTEAALAAIAPASDTEMEMVRECLRADNGNNTKRGASLDLMAAAFGDFVKVNPSLLASLKLFGSGRPSAW